LADSLLLVVVIVVSANSVRVSLFSFDVVASEGVEVVVVTIELAVHEFRAEREFLHGAVLATRGPDGKVSTDVFLVIVINAEFEFFNNGVVIVVTLVIIVILFVIIVVPLVIIVVVVLGSSFLAIVGVCRRKHNCTG